MDYDQVEEQFKTLKEQFTAGTLDEAAFKARLNELMVQDGQGRWWMIGYETGQWYTHDGAAWVRADPPGRGMPQPAQAEPKRVEKAQTAAVPAKRVEEANPVSAEPATPAVKTTPETLEPANAVKKMGWGFWLRWVGSILAGLGVLILLILVTNSNNDYAGFWIFTAVVVTGTLQWLIMRPYGRGFGWWILLSSVYAILLAVFVTSANTYPWPESATIIAQVLGVLYPVFSLVAGPAWVARKRRSVERMNTGEP